MIRPHRLLVASTLLLVIGACSDHSSSKITSSGASPKETITVFAAASLVDAFTKIGSTFEVDHPGIRIEFNFASSSELATQIREGAPTDVFASADTKNVDTLRSAGIALGTAHTFAMNRLEIVVAPGNPKGIRSLEDLADPDLVFVTCDESVPIGRYTAQVLAAANVTTTPASYENNVRGIVNKIVLGEADAGIVYHSDIVAAGSSVLGVPIPDRFNIVASYPIVAVGNDPSPATRAFIEFVTSSDQARSILDSYGFVLP